MKSTDIVSLFNNLFSLSHQTILMGGADEPLYKYSRAKGGLHVIYFRADYESSALHEVAHWCIAGPARRKLDDYGYWYEADREPRQQRLFERYEARPQALEWLLSIAANVEFRVSRDSFDFQENTDMSFRSRIWEQAVEFSTHGLPARAELLARGLRSNSGVSDSHNANQLKAMPA